MDTNEVKFIHSAKPDRQWKPKTPITLKNGPERTVAQNLHTTLSDQGHLKQVKVLVSAAVGRQ